MGLFLKALREQVYEANLDLVRRGLVMETFGNVSGVDRDAGVFVIKASGVPYDDLTAEHMVPVSLETGLPVETRFRPSSDTDTHHELYLAFPRCGGVAHTHSEFATAFAQARRAIPCMGTTHADYFRGDIPVTRPMTEDEVRGAYERNTGRVIVEAFTAAGLSGEDITAALVANHGPFVWGVSCDQAVERAAVVEFLARMTATQHALAPAAPRPADFLIDKHFSRKHGAKAYYGQR